MTEVLTDTGVLLPVETLAFLGSGPQGAAAILNYGIRSEDFDVEFARLTERLEASADVEAPAQLAISRTIVAVARVAQAWLSVRSNDPQHSPAILLVGEDAALAAILHGVAVEYVVGETDLVHRVIGGALGRKPGAEVQVTLFVGEIALAGARIENGTVDVAAGSADRLERLSAGAGAGLSDLVDALLRELQQ